MAKTQTKQAQEPEAAIIPVGGWARFLGYPKNTPKEEQILVAGESYEVIEEPGFEEIDGKEEETGYILRLPNPDFDDSKKESDDNPAFLETEVFPDEVEEGEAPAEDDPVTYAELAGYSLEELIDFAKANDVKLTAAQKKKPELALAAIAKEFELEPEEAEEPETPPAKPETAAAKKKREAAEAAAKAAADKPAGKGATKPAGKAEAKPSTKGKGDDQGEEHEEQDPDFVPDLEGEDEEVLALVEGDVNLIDVARDLESQASISEYRLGGVLYHIKKEKLHLATDKKGKLLEPEYGEAGGFKKFLMDNFNIDYRKAAYLIDIYINFTLAGIESPAEVIGNIGWTKASKISKLVSAEDADVAGLIEAAEKNTVQDLSEILKEQFSPDGGSSSGSDAGAKKTRVTLKFRYLEEEGNTIEDALKELSELWNVKPEEALLQAVIDVHSAELGKGKGSTKGGKGDDDGDEGAQSSAPAKGGSRRASAKR